VQHQFSRKATPPKSYQINGNRIAKLRDSIGAGKRSTITRGSDLKKETKLAANAIVKDENSLFYFPYERHCCPELSFTFGVLTFPLKTGIIFLLKAETFLESLQQGSLPSYVIRK